MPHKRDVSISPVPILAVFLAAALSASCVSSQRKSPVKEVQVQSADPVAQLVERAKAELARNYSAPRTLSQLAASVGCSHVHLARTFRAHTGQTLHDYRNRMRLARALLEVAEGESDLSGLALRLGYSSHSHLTSHFRRAFGVTPARARAVLRGSATSGARLRELSGLVADAVDSLGGA